MTRPVTPEEIQKLAKMNIPEGVIKVINKMIAEKWNGFSATLAQKEVVWEIIKRMNTTKDSVESNGWLNFEDIYRAAGWTVTYDKPDRGETHDATFTFLKAAEKRT